MLYSEGSCSLTICPDYATYGLTNASIPFSAPLSTNISCLDIAQFELTVAGPLFKATLHALILSPAASCPLPNSYLLLAG